ncbi:MAG: 4'-phosphopantetheinyl transferase superfamily protein [Gammaproteobacteria bacterium]|nr:4'-phosphopantetheinyl transferase superfamily protein [Gammaproteobacteria bacterium]
MLTFKPANIIRPDINKLPELKSGEIHLFVFSVTDIFSRLQQLSSCLSATEEKRAARFINQQHGDNYRCIRGQLRTLLSAYLKDQPSNIQIEYEEHGKPFLNNKRQLQFNLSHSRDRVAFVFCRDSVIGVDIEFMRPQKNFAGMLRHVASVREQQELMALNEPSSFNAFYRLWTRKEAYIKAVGRGLGMGLRSIYVGTEPLETFTSVEYKGQIQSNWQVLDVTAPENFKLAICVNSEELQ